MRRAWPAVGLAGVLALSACAAAPGAPAVGAARASPGVAKPAARVPTDVRRVTILVRDMDESLRLWRDTLGLVVNYDEQLTVSGVALPAGVPGNRVRLVLLNGNDAWVGWIGLMHYTDPPLADVEPPTRLGIGGQVIILDTDDAERRCTAVAALPGVRMAAPARLQVYPGRTPGALPIRVVGCNFFDRDGSFVELNQLLREP